MVDTKIRTVQEAANPDTRSSSIEVAAPSTSAAESTAAQILQDAHSQAAEILAQARQVAEQDVAQDRERVQLAEQERDSAFDRARQLSQQLTEMHESTLDRIRVADEERDTALARAHKLSVELNDLHDTTMERVRKVEDERDAALARSRQLSQELETLYTKIAELREQLYNVASLRLKEQSDLTSARLEIANLRTKLAELGAIRPSLPSGGDEHDDDRSKRRGKTADGMRVLDKPVVGD
ncbi:hypothetical protein ACFPM7_28120 [Actinokineospora guangxiensis]|uniref:Uncharacterized protein n=1 Tax=Actinokineospora guangxiensis TaxID=1490288 RepID=A0ABW0EUR9_9PSEU